MTYTTFPSHRPTLLDVNWSKNQAPLTGSHNSRPTSHILPRRNRSVSSNSSWHNCGIDDIERVVLVRWAANVDGDSKVNRSEYLHQQF